MCLCKPYCENIQHNVHYSLHFKKAHLCAIILHGPICLQYFHTTDHTTGFFTFLLTIDQPSVLLIPRVLWSVVILCFFMVTTGGAGLTNSWTQRCVSVGFGASVLCVGVVVILVKDEIVLVVHYCTLMSTTGTCTLTLHHNHTAWLNSSCSI